jgi:polyphenol oxidase
MLKTSFCSFFFGNATTCPIAATRLKPVKEDDRHGPEFMPWANELRQKLGLTHLVFQKQVHGVEGWNITDTHQLIGSLDCFTHVGDFLTTDQINVGIGVLTADCLPIIFYAPKKHAVAIAHAGWQGSVKNIATETLIALRTNYGIDPADVQIVFGPAAQVCCYEVKKDFEQNLHGCAYQQLSERNGHFYFDNPKLNMCQLIAAGVKQENIDLSHHACTICNHEFHSYRRAENKNNYGTQATIVWINGYS